MVEIWKVHNWVAIFVIAALSFMLVKAVLRKFGQSDLANLF